MMTWNPYSKIFSLSSGKRALFNYVNDSAIILSKQLSDIIEPLIQTGKVSEIASMHPQLYQSLLINKFILTQSQSCDSRWILDLLQQKLQSKRIFRLCVNPTLDCNLRCWYCYQTHTKNCYMPSNTQDAVLKYAERKIVEEELETFQLSFFGGEPLLQAKKIAFPLAEQISGLCEKYSKKFLLHFTTNGVLLSESMLNKMKAICPESSLQIPFDGGRNFHNQTKQNQRGIGCYDITLKNIYKAVALDVHVNVRCNYTLENIESFEELVSEIRTKTLGKEHLVSFSLQRVWQEKITEELSKKAERISSLIAEGSNKFSESGKGIPPTFCYADFENSVVINYDGSLYKCTARDFVQENKIGVLTANGEASIQTDKYSLKRRYKEVCKSCSILPICTICVQARCEASSPEVCPVVMSEEDKQRQIRNRFLTIYGELV